MAPRNLLLLYILAVNMSQSAHALGPDAQLRVSQARGEQPRDEQPHGEQPSDAQAGRVLARG